MHEHECVCVGGGGSMDEWVCGWVCGCVGVWVGGDPCKSVCGEGVNSRMRVDADVGPPPWPGWPIHHAIGTLLLSHPWGAHT